VDFGGSSFSIGRWGIGFVEVQGSRNVSFLNATLDWDQELPFTQGIITATDPASSKITVRLEPGFPEFDAPYFVKSGYFGILLHPNVPGRMKGGVPGHFEFQRRTEVKIGDRLWELPVSDKNHTRYFEVGDRFVRFARHGARSLADSSHSEQITYYGITSYTSPGSLHYTSLYDNELAVLHCQALIKEGRWFGGSADGVHAKGHRIGPWIEGFVVRGLTPIGGGVKPKPHGGVVFQYSVALQKKSGGEIRHVPIEYKLYWKNGGQAVQNLNFLVV
jgi:hypothetical protein